MVANGTITANYSTQYYLTLVATSGDGIKMDDESLKKLLKSENWTITAAVAENSTSPEILDMLARHKKWIVKAVVAENLYTSEKTLEKLAKDEDERVSATARKRLESLLRQ